MGTLLDLKEEIIKNVEKGNSQKTARLLLDYLEKIDLNHISEFTDHLLLALRTDNGKEVGEIFNQLTQNSADVGKIFQMEKFFIEKHLLFEDERLLDSFYGTLHSNLENIKGRLFLTNFRIIATGFSTELKSGKTLEFEQHYVAHEKGLIGKPMSMIANKAIKKWDVSRILNAIKQSLNLGFYSINHLQYGSYYRFSRPNDITISSQAITFSLKITYIVTGIESHSDKIFVQIMKMRMLGETENEFQENALKTYNLIEKTLKEESVIIKKNMLIAEMASISDIGGYLGQFFYANQGKAWTATAIFKRIDQLNLPKNIQQRITVKKIARALESLSKGYINFDEHEGNLFYYL